MSDVQVRLTKEIRHYGRLLPPGTELTVTEKYASWIVRQGFAELVDTNTAASRPIAALLRRPCCGRSR